MILLPDGPCSGSRTKINSHSEELRVQRVETRMDRVTRCWEDALSDIVSRKQTGQFLSVLVIPLLGSSCGILGIYSAVQSVHTQGSGCNTSKTK